MKPILSIILLCLVAAPVCRSKIVDDERRWSDDDDESNEDSDENSDEDTSARYGPAPLAHNGQVVDTGDVKQAKRRHFQAYAKMASLAANRGSGGHRDAADEGNGWKGNGEHGDNSDAGRQRWTGPFAEVEFTSDGFLKYTPEVALEREKHLSAHAAATALAEQNGSSGLDNGHNGRQDGGHNGGQNGGQKIQQDDGQDDSSEQDGGDNSDEQDEY